MSNRIPEFVAALAARMPDLDRVTVEAIRSERPATVAAIGVATVEHAVVAADEQFLIGVGGRMDAAVRAVAPLAAALGVAALRTRTPLEDLTATYRIYQRRSWVVAADIMAELDLGAPLVAEIAGAYITFADEFTRASAEAYAGAASEAGAARLFARRELLAALTREPPNLADLDGQAAAAGWQPREVVRAAVGFDIGVAWPRDALAGTIDGEDLAVLGVEVPPTLRAACGPPVPLRDLPRSLAIARRLRDAAGPADATLLWEDHLPRLVLNADPTSAGELARRTLAPIDEAPARQRAWLEPTLRAWLANPGSPTRVAQALHLHPQSARYRIARLREVIGDGVDDPEVRFALRLALEARDAIA